MWTHQFASGFFIYLFTMTTGTRITSTEGESEVIQWTVNPVPPSGRVVAVLYPHKVGNDYGVLFSALGTNIIPGVETLSSRVSNTGNTNTNTGHIEFTLSNITVEDAGDYSTRHDPGTGAVNSIGATLVVYAKPSNLIIAEEAAPVDGENMILNCTATSSSRPVSFPFNMTYNWYRNGANLTSGERYVVSGTKLQVKNIKKTDNGTVFTCNSYETPSLLSDVSDGYTTVVNYGPDTVTPDKPQQHLLVENSEGNNTLGPITCSADCVPPCTYQWMFNGVDYGSPGNTLTIHNKQRAAAGSYWCEASNDYGTRSSKNITLTIESGPISILPNTRQQHFLIENKEDNNTLGPIKCKADCEPACTYQWKFNGKNFGSLGDTLIIYTIQRNASGTYWCVASNAHGNSSSKNVTVNVLYGPGTIQLDKLQTQLLVENKTGNNTLGPITCSADCVPDCTYQWKFNGEDVGSSGDTLTIEDIQRSSAGTYWCVASNGYGIRKSNNVTVTVEYAPAIVSPTTSLYHSIVENRDGNDTLGPIKCSSDCEPTCTYQWKFNGTDYGSPGDTLAIYNTKRTSAGTYWCEASNVHGFESSENVTVKVLYKPGIVDPEKAQQYILTEDQKGNNTLGPIACSADCIPDCIYQWKFNGVDFGSPSDTLTINNIQRNATGTYWCVASNDYGTGRSKDAMVTVQYGPNFVTLTPNTNFYNPAEAETLGPIICSADCVPKCSYQWSHDGTILHNEASVAFKDITRTDSGIYVCSAFNIIGSRNSSLLNLNVEYTPENITLQPSLTQYNRLENTSLGPINCTADCNPPCLYQWERDGGNRTRTSVLNIYKIQRHQSGTYTCVAWNERGNIVSQGVSVDVQYGPGVVTLSPNNRSYVLVENIRDTLGPITCQSDCNPKCTYSWTLNETVLQYQGQILNMNNVLRDQAGVYTCTASNSVIDNNYNSSSSLSMAVEYGPGGVMLVPSNPSYTLLEKNDTLRPIGCSAVCLPPCTYEWTKDGDKIDSALMSQQRTASRTMAGQYICTAKNVYNVSTTVVYVVVEYTPDPPQLAKSTKGALVENEPFTLSCTTDSFPLPDISIVSLEMTEKRYRTHNSLVNNVTVNRADCLDTGRYRCTATNKIGSSVSSEVSINVTCSPRLDKRNKTETDIYLGDNENLDIVAPIIANPQPVLAWEFKTNTSGEPIMLYNGTDDFMYYKEAKHVTYRIQAEKSSMQSDDYGLYILNASNSYNYTEITFRVFAKRSPDPPYAASVKCDGQTDATLSWKSGFNGGEKQYFIVKSLLSSSNDKAIADKGQNALHETEITKLNPNTRYSFVIEAHNNNGHSKFEQLLNCTTKPLEKKTGAPLALIGGLAGGLAALIIIVVILGVVLFVKRRKHKKEEDTQLMNLRDNQDEGMKANILYESAGPFLSRQIDDPSDPEYAEVDKSRGEPSNNSSNDVYATVQKNKTTTEDPSAMYSVVQKPNKASKSAETPKGKKQMKGKGKAKGDKKQDKRGKRDDVYENFGATFEDEYANVERKPKQGSSEDQTQSKQKTPSRRKNKDGLTYIDVEIMDNGKGPKINGIHGADKRVDYVDIDFTRRADPLPSSSDEDEQPGDSSSAQPQTEEQQ